MTESAVINGIDKVIPWRTTYQSIAFGISLLCAIVTVTATFSDVLALPAVGGALSVNTFQIAPYIANLNEQFGRWLPEMMMEPTGSNMSFLLRLASPALYVVTAFAVIAIPALVAYVISYLKRWIMAARILGVIGFISSAIFPLLLFVAQAIVSYEFSSGPLPPVTIISAEPSAFLWLLCAVIGAVSVVFATKKSSDKRS